MFVENLTINEISQLFLHGDEDLPIIATSMLPDVDGIAVRVVEYMDMQGRRYHFFISDLDVRDGVKPVKVGKTGLPSYKEEFCTYRNATIDDRATKKLQKYLHNKHLWDYDDFVAKHTNHEYYTTEYYNNIGL